MEIRWLNKYSKQFLEKDYLLPGQTVLERLKIIGDTAERILGIAGFSEKVQDYIAKGWISPSTPIWTNFGTNRGLPISCFGSYIPDSIQGILQTAAEVGTMLKNGGGTSGYFGSIRGRGETISSNGSTHGSKPFLGLFEQLANVINQGSVRRGYFSGYIDIDHKDIEEWLTIRGEGDAIQHLTWGVCVPDQWLNEMEAGDKKKRKIWAKVIQKRFETGLPYIFYTDNANNGESVPDVYRGKGRIKASQMCTEIFLPSDEVQSFVCDLASTNDTLYDEWKDTDCVEVVTFLLDAAMTEFIEKAGKIQYFERAVAFAKAHRALGIGRIGYHSYLQNRMIPFESLQARNINYEIQKTIYEQALAASKKLADLYGECEETKGTGRRNTTLIAIAPTTSSAFILGQVSQSIEPWTSNLFTKDLAKGKFLMKNQELEKLLKKYDKNTDEVWESIKINHGSVLHLDFLTDLEKNVFKTAKEIDQNEIITQAGARQKYIDQGQSLNLFISSDKNAKYVNGLLLKAHKLGIKSLYYQHNVNAAQILTRQLLNCASCE
jgi:ribonucleoside-diphosphate reductase alpha chain